jgi:hypothetical protein
MEMRGRFVLCREDARTFERDVDAKVLVRKVGRIPDRGDADLVAVDDHVLTIDAHGSWKAAVHRVVPQKVRVRLDRPKIVYTHDDNVAPLGFNDRAQHKPADAAKTVDRDADGHEFLLNFEAGAGSGVFPPVFSGLC